MVIDRFVKKLTRPVGS